MMAMKLRIIGALIVLCTIAAGPGSIAKFKSVSFASTTPLATNGELIHRLFSPFAAADVAKKNDAASLNSFPIDPKEEKFGLYVPEEKPAKGYGLLVWVSPLDGANMPLGWPETLEKRGIIYVTAARSGNFTSPLGRRIPLALTAAANVAGKYAIDPDRIWIAGFSGGARIAERMALAYPDLFSGAILDGSSDPIGTADVSLPSRENFEEFLNRTSIVISTGAKDRYNTQDARRVIASLRRHCFDRVSIEVRPHEGHDAMNGTSLASAIDFLDQARGRPSSTDRHCLEQLYAQIDDDLARAEAKVQNDSNGARAALRRIDRLYGQLAAARSLDLRARTGG